MTLARGSVQAIVRDGKYSNRHLFVSGKHKERAKAFETEKGNVVNKIDSIVLKVRIENDHYFFSHEEDEGEFVTVLSEKLPFQNPEYIGLAAFQGRPEIPYPVYPLADTIAAHFEYVEVYPCSDIE